MKENKELVQEQLEVTETIENMDEKTLANIVSDGLKYRFTKSFLVKQLPATMVEKTVKMPIPTGEKDEDGNDVTEMKEDVIQVESVLRTGIIIKMPVSIEKTNTEDGFIKYSIGDRIVYRNMRATDFDLFKDSALVDPFDVICIEE